MQAAGGSGKAARLYRIETFGIYPPITRPKRHRMLAAAHIVLCDRDPETTAARSDADHEPSQLASRWWNGQVVSGVAGVRELLLTRATFPRVARPPRTVGASS